METRQKKSLALTLIGHGVVLMAVFLSAAFLHRPKIEYMEIDPGLGGPKSPRSSGGAPPPAASRDDTREPPRPNPQSKAAEPPKEKSEFPTKKAPPKKISVPKKKPVAKKSPAKPAVRKSNKLVVRSKAATPPPKPGASESAGDIRRRMEGRIGQPNTSSEPSPGGDGSGNATGTANRFAVYLGGLQEQIQIAWEQPSAAETGLKTEVAFLLEKSGHLTGIRIVKSSGNLEMDQSALFAVKSIGAYQPWPEDFTSDLARITVDFECKPNP